MTAVDDPASAGGSQSSPRSPWSRSPSPHPSSPHTSSLCPVAPFPVEVPYRTRADLARLEGPAFPRLPDDDALRALKARALRERPERIRVPDPGRGADAVAADVAVTLPRIAELRPDVIRPADLETDLAGNLETERAGDLVPAASTIVTDVHGRAWAFPALGPEAAEALRACPPATRAADALALSLPDDLAWMRDDGAAGRASLLHVSFPSHWAPDARAGASLAELHGPVADGEALRAASAALMRAIVRKGPFRRWVWSVQATPALDLHPQARTEGDDGAAPAPIGSEGSEGSEGVLASAWFRVERQTTVPFPEAGLALFAIRIQVTPLAQVLDERPGRAARLGASIRSMSAGARRYKGLVGADALLEALDRRAEGEAEAQADAERSAEG